MYRASVVIVVESEAGASADIYAVREISEQEYVEIQCGYESVSPTCILKLRPLIDPAVREAERLLREDHRPLAVYVDGVRRGTFRWLSSDETNDPGTTPSVTIALEGNTAAALASEAPLGWSMSNCSLAQMVAELVDPWGFAVLLGEAAALRYGRTRRPPVAPDPTEQAVAISEGHLVDAYLSRTRSRIGAASEAGRAGWSPEHLETWRRAREAEQQAAQALRDYRAAADAERLAAQDAEIWESAGDFRVGLGPAPDALAANLARTVEPRQVVMQPDETIGDFLSRIASQSGLLLHETCWGDLALVVPDYTVRPDRPVIYSPQPGEDQPTWSEGLILSSGYRRSAQGPTRIEGRNRVGAQADKLMINHVESNPDYPGRYQYERLQGKRCRDLTELSRACKVQMAAVRHGQWTYQNTVCGYGIGAAVIREGGIVRVEDYIHDVHADLYALTTRVRFGEGRAPVIDVKYVRPGTWVVGETIRDVFVPEPQQGPWNDEPS